jgi:hypothetical protein
MRRFLAFCIILFTAQQAFSQAQQQGPTCAQTLRLARATYEQGRLQEIELQLKSCLESGFTKEEKQLKVEGYKILCLSYIYLEEPEKADEAMLNILRTDPYFQINAAVDPAEFVALYYTFRTWPIYRIGAKLGLNASQPNVSETITAVDINNGGSGEYKYLIGFQVGAAADLPLYFISKKLTLHADLMFQQKRFELTLNANRGEGTTGEPFTNNFTGIEAQSWLSLPVTIEYEIIDNKKFHPYVALGAGIDYLMGSTITTVRPRDNQASIEEKSFSPKREKINLNVIAAAGVKLPLASGFIVAEVRYFYGLSDITSQETALSNTKFALDYGYADSIFKVNSVAITAGYIVNIFNPKKLKRK